MDHDAMWTHVQKLMKFRDDFLVLSKVTAEEFHLMAERVRAGGDRQEALDQLRHPEDHKDEAKEPAQDLVELDPKTSSTTVVAKEPAAELDEGVAGDGQDVSGALKPETGTEAASGAEKAPDDASTGV